MAGTTNYAGIVKWAQLDLQGIQHRDYVGHLSICHLTKYLQNMIEDIGVRVSYILPGRSAIKVKIQELLKGTCLCAKIL